MALNMLEQRIKRYLLKMSLLECNVFVFEGFEDFEDFWMFGFVF